MGLILTLIEDDAAAAQLLGTAAGLGTPVAVAPAGSGADPPEAERVAAFGAAGAARVVLVEGAARAWPHAQPGAVAAVLADLAAGSLGEDAAAVLAPGDAFGAEVGALLALALDSGVVTDAIRIAPDFSATKAVMAETALVDVGVARGLPIFTIGAAAAPEPAAPVAAPVVSR
ncbi:MAG: hypothetical protein LBD97_04320, partial [Bifidobacteriaceae bacterium]|nr:hypothetical protein [Bifidobacteriaceae bacterium]